MNRILAVHDNRVNCPRRGDLDVDLCVLCPDIVDVRHRGDDTFVVCRPVLAPLGTRPYGPGPFFA